MISWELTLQKTVQNKTFGSARTDKIQDLKISFQTKYLITLSKPYLPKLARTSLSGNQLNIMTITNAPNTWEENSWKFLNIQSTFALLVILTLNSEYIHTIDMYLGLYSDQKQIRATATGFFNQSVRNIKKIIENKE